eukprot:gnl/Carplike_NY0171/18173_a28287_69.p1 GENE.gnl/Carplike_NY0171/18173_a28287_69~~gnl/Carplike_NY0171/18173_a28287_69.p1  ORF type:complete len:207 (-),score=42.90 gnl/Carplike_NY0171/18173_a28287_69:214-768(-)
MFEIYDKKGKKYRINTSNIIPDDGSFIRSSLADGHQELGSHSHESDLKLEESRKSYHLCAFPSSPSHSSSFESLLSGSGPWVVPFRPFGLPRGTLRYGTPGAMFVISCEHALDIGCIRIKNGDKGYEIAEFVLYCDGLLLFHGCLENVKDTQSIVLSNERAFGDDVKVQIGNGRGIKTVLTNVE